MQIAQAKELNITVGFSHFPPWQITKKGDLVGGIDKMVLNALQEELASEHDIRLHINYYYCPLKRCLAMMQTGQLDMKTGLLRQPEREWYVYFITPPYQRYVHKALYVHKDGPSNISTYNAMKTLKIGVTRASVNFPEFDQDKLIEKVKVNGTRNGLRMLSAKRFDAFLGSELVTDYFIRKDRLGKEIRKASYKYKKENPGYFGIAKKSPLSQYLPQLRSAMKAIVEKGYVQLAEDQVLFFSP
ncbi:MAG: transporter substrate-binding domain-containing protein [Methylocystaceae bacterium]|nr:transporter substrate-binding domain-containing protein [Methylocystaceae bacterium]